MAKKGFGHASYRFPIAPALASSMDASTESQNSMTKPTLSWTSKLAIQMTRSPPCMHGSYMLTQLLWKDLRPTLLSYHQFQKWDCSTLPRTNVSGLTLQGRYLRGR